MCAPGASAKGEDPCEEVHEAALALMLCLLLVLSLAPAVSAAQADDALLVEDMTAGRAAAAAGQSVSGAGTTEWNERLGEKPLLEAQTFCNAAEENTTKAAATFYPDDSVEELMAYLRSQLKARKTSFSFTYVTTAVYDYDTFAANVLLTAFEHTGVPTEGDYLQWQWRTRGYGYSGYARQYVTYTYNLTYLTTAAQEAAMDTAVANLLTELDLDGRSDYQKVRRIYDYICANVTYDYAGLNKGVDASPLTWTAYKALTQGTSVCQGYALLFYRLALESGVDARFIGGDSGGPHAWNIVALGDRYYNLDATWDAGRTGYSWFLLSDASFVNHTRDPEYRTSAFYSDYPMAAADYVPAAVLPGDMDGNDRLTTDDAVYLLLNIMFGAGDYAIAAAAHRDTDGDGTVTTDDAVYLLLHVMFGATDYPLAA